MLAVQAKHGAQNQAKLAEASLDRHAGSQASGAVKQGGVLTWRAHIPGLIVRAVGCRHDGR